MDAWIFSSDWRARLALIFGVACFYVGAVLINNTLLFSWAADSSYRHWIYPPAGIRLVLIMLLGWPALAGLAIATLAQAYSDLIPQITRFDDAMLVAIVRVASIWLSLKTYGWITKVKSPWRDLTWVHVPFLALFVNTVSDIALSMAYVYLGIENLDTFVRNVALYVFGDTVGTILVLMILIKLRQAYTKSHAMQSKFS